MAVLFLQSGTAAFTQRLIVNFGHITFRAVAFTCKKMRDISSFFALISITYCNLNSSGGVSYWAVFIFFCFFTPESICCCVSQTRQHIIDRQVRKTMCDFRHFQQMVFVSRRRLSIRILVTFLVGLLLLCESWVQSQSVHHFPTFSRLNVVHISICAALKFIITFGLPDFAAFIADPFLRLHFSRSASVAGVSQHHLPFRWNSSRQKSFQIFSDCLSEVFFQQLRICFSTPTFGQIFRFQFWQVHRTCRTDGEE